MPGYDVAASFGITVEFLTSGFSAEIMDIDGPSPSRGSIDVTHQGVGTPSAGQFGNRLFIPEDLVDGGEVTLSCHFNPDTVPPVHGANETVQITWPKASGDTSAATWSFPGHVTNYPVSAPLGDKMTADVTVKVAGTVSVVAAA